MPISVVGINVSTLSAIRATAKLGCNYKLLLVIIVDARTIYPFLPVVNYDLRFVLYRGVGKGNTSKRRHWPIINMIRVLIIQNQRKFCS